MGSQVILLICIGLSAIQIVCGQVWEFGTDNIPTAVIITNYDGQFTFFQKEQNIQLIVPPCHIVTYVNVQVENRISNPKVYYNYAKGIVTLSYRFWQFSPSTYTITAKGIRRQGCYNQPDPAHPGPEPMARGPAPVVQVPGQIRASSINSRYQLNPDPQVEQPPQDEPHPNKITETGDGESR